MLTSSDQKYRSSQRFTPLPLHTSQGNQKPSTIAIVSPDIIGPKHGGIGTAYTLLAEALAGSDHRVHLLFVPSRPFEMNEHRRWIDQYREKGIHLAILDKWPRSNQHTLSLQRSFGVYRWLLDHSDLFFDTIHFPEWSGVGYHALLAHRQKHLLPHANMVVGVHSSTRWLNTFNEDRIVRHLYDLDTIFLEEESIRLADVVISPSQYYLEWLDAQGVTLPSRSHFIPNLIEGITSSSPIADHQTASAHVPVREVVFFGRLERRKGLTLFCDAMDRSTLRNRSDISLTFMGHLREVQGIPSDLFIRQRAKKWNTPIRILTELGRNEALDYLSGPGRLSAIPSLAETMGYTVLECLNTRIPFLATRVGGIPELIATQDLDRVTCLPEPDSLAAGMDRTLQEGLSPAHPAMDPAKTHQIWLRWHEPQRIEEKLSTPRLRHSVQTSVCLLIENLSNDLFDVLDALKNQQETSFDLVATIHTSLLQSPKGQEFRDNLSSFGGILLEHPSLPPDLIWKMAADRAKGEYLLFMESTLLPDANMLSTFLSVQQSTGADILTTTLNQTSEDSGESISIPFLGPALSSGFFKNIFGDGAFLITRTAFESCKDRWSQPSHDSVIGTFLRTAVLRGLHLETIPFPLFTLWSPAPKKLQPDPITSPPWPVLPHTYTSHFPKEFRDLALFMQATASFFTASSSGKTITSPQSIVDDYWNSRPFALSRRLTGRLKSLFGGDKERCPRVSTLGESIETIHRLQSSPAGIIAGVFSLAGRTLKRG